MPEEGTTTKITSAFSIASETSEVAFFRTANPCGPPGKLSNSIPRRFAITSMWQKVRLKRVTSFPINARWAAMALPPLPAPTTV
jgi:hypothetical protein